MAVPGIGQFTATATVATVSQPREHSSGGKQRLYGITKRGDRFLRSLLIHGARSALRCADGKGDRILRWALKLAERRGHNVAAVALANKLARIVWAMLAHGRTISRTTGPPDGGPMGSNQGLSTVNEPTKVAKDKTERCPTEGRTGVG